MGWIIIRPDFKRISCTLTTEEISSQLHSSRRFNLVLFLNHRYTSSNLILTFCLLSILHAFWSFAVFCVCVCFFCVFFFQKSIFSEISFGNTTRVLNSSGPDQARRFVRPDLGPNCW